MRVLLPAGVAVLLAVLLAEGLAGGPEAVERLLRTGFPVTLLILLLTAVAIVFLLLLLQGRELADVVIDSRGVHETRYLPDPTALKLLARLKPPSLLKDADSSAAVPLVKLGERHLPWREVSRVQLWPEKCVILFYAPAWWLRIAVVCTPFSWTDALSMIREKLGRKKKVLLPPTLTVAPAPAARRAKPAARPVPAVEEALEQLRMEEAEPPAPDPLPEAEDEPPRPEP